MGVEAWEQKMAEVVAAAVAEAAGHNAADEAFVQGMIPHHQAAIEMVVELGTRGVSPEVRSLAAGIKTAQEREITAMKVLLATWGVKPGGGMHD